MRGFYSGFAAALAVIALAGLLWVSLSVSQRDVSDLSQFDAVVASARAQDAAGFLADAMADAALDAAFAAHGCQPGPAFCSNQGLAARIGPYAEAAAGALSGRMAVGAQAALLSCAAVAPDAAHQQAYAFSIRTTGSVHGAKIDVPFGQTSDFVLQLNATPVFVADVNASPSWRVSVTCPAVP